MVAPCTCPLCAAKTWLSADEPAADPSIVGGTDPGVGGGVLADAAKPSWTLSQIVSQLTRTRTSWPSGAITYSFMASNPGSSYGVESAGFSVFNGAQQAAARLAMDYWSAVANVTFIPVSDAGGGGQIRFANTTSGPGQAWAYNPGTAARDGDVWINPNQPSNLQLGLGQFGLMTLIHEIGHSLGLSHPGEYDASKGASSYSADAIYLQDSRQYSIMSYFTETNTGGDFIGYYSSTPMVDDIAAVQSLYGARTTSTNTVYGFNSTAGSAPFDFTTNSHPVVTIWDGGGIDTLDLSGFSKSSRIDLNPGAFSDANGMIDNISIAYNTDIEKAVGGSGADSITGNALANTLTGGLGNDTIDGEAGTDTAVFSGVAANYKVTKFGATYTFVGPDGTDLLTNIELIQFGTATPVAIDTLIGQHTITFSEYAIGTVNPTYAFGDNTVFISGMVVSDGAQPNSPAAAANAKYIGPVFINFLTPVTRVSFDAGYFDQVGSTTIDFLASDGSLVGHQLNTGFGIIHYSLELAAGITGVRVVNTGLDDLGFSVDTLVFSGSAAAQATSLEIRAVDVNRYEGQSGTTTFNFVVNRTGNLATATTVRWSVGGTTTYPALADDFGGTLPSGTVSFAANERSKTIAVAVSGDRVQESDEAFTVTLFAPSANTSITSPTAVATILNDDQSVYSTIKTFLFRLMDASFQWRDGTVIVTGPDKSVTPLSGVTKYVFSDGTVDTTTGSPLVDKLYYYANNKDVWAAKADADAHYNQYGWKEGRNPNAFFSSTGYIAANPDVKALGINPLTHFDQYGWKEGRDPSAGFDDTLYLLSNADVKATGMDPLKHYLQYGRDEGRMAFASVGSAARIIHGSFDAQYYLLNNADVAKSVPAGVSPYEYAYQHYVTNGWHEGRNPNAFFDVKGYLAAYTDVAAAKVDPLAHFDQYGWKEGRDPSAQFDVRDYLVHNADVKNVGMNPLTHYLAYGNLEGRAVYADLKFG